MWLKGLKNNKKKNCMFLDFGFEALCWGDNISIYIYIYRYIFVCVCVCV